MVTMISILSMMVMLRVLDGISNADDVCNYFDDNYDYYDDDYDDYFVNDYDYKLRQRLR